MSSRGIRALLVCSLFGVLGSLPVRAALAQSVSPAIDFWLPGPGASADPTFVGVVERPASGSAFASASPMVEVAGWVVDKTAQGWSGIDDIQVWDGLMGLGGQRLAEATFQLNRPDVAVALGDQDWAASGFSASVPTARLAQGGGILYVYGHTPSKGWWYTQAVLGLPAAPAQQNPQIDIETPTPLATVHSSKPFTIRGYAVDRSASSNQGTGIDRVQVYLNGDRQTGISLGDAMLGQSNVASAAFGGQFASAGFALSFQPASWLSSISDNQITPLVIYAHSSVTGRETESRVQIVISVP